MRKDSQGLFWQDVDDRTAKKIKLLTENNWTEMVSGYWSNNNTCEESEWLRFDEAYALVREKTTNTKREPPEPTWLEPTYLPYLNEALEFDIPLFKDYELADAALEYNLTGIKHKLIFDIESYPNYFLIGFKSVTLPKCTFLEIKNNSEIDLAKLNWILNNFCLISFNGIHYDMAIATIVAAGRGCLSAYAATSAIIDYNQKSYEVLRSYKLKKLKVDHIDVKEVCPGSGSLKILGGRIHTKRMQDLPFQPGINLSEEQIAITRYYCMYSDLNATYDLYKALKVELDLRIKMGLQYKIDLRSKSDAQIAEAIIASEVSKLNGCWPHKPVIAPGTCFNYKPPAYLKFKTPTMQWHLNNVVSLNYVVGEDGKIIAPKELGDNPIVIAGKSYKLQIGGLHSQEKRLSCYSDSEFELGEADVTSYYPYLILNNRWFPSHLGEAFLIVYKTIVETRLKAKLDYKLHKLEKDKIIAESLKIVINGSFGKLGSRWSVLYSPDLLLQVTLTGQLTLLLLIEELELNGIHVVSGNTDGIVVKCPRDKIKLKESIFKQWEANTMLNLEWTPYKSTHYRDVNNYIAVKEGTRKFKTKGAYARAGLKKNPVNEICIDALEALLSDSVPISETVRNCTNIDKFVNVRTVKGGAVKNGEFLGKAIRWYYANNIEDEIIYAKSGNKVPRSDGAKPMMDKYDEFPNDVDYDWYIEETNKILKHIGYDK